MNSYGLDYANAVKALVDKVGVDEVLRRFGSPRGLVEDMLNHTPPKYAGQPKEVWLRNNQEEAARIVAGVLGLM